MPKVETNNINIYGAAVVGITTVRVHLFKGKWVFNVTTGKYVDAPALGAGGLTADHRVVNIAVPHTSNKIGYEVTVPDSLPVGEHDLLFLDNLTYVHGIRLLKTTTGKLVDITNKSIN